MYQPIYIASLLLCVHGNIPTTVALKLIAFIKMYKKNNFCAQL